MTSMKDKTKLSSPGRRLTFSAMFLALALVLPFLTGQIPQIGSLLSLMHLPAFLCGLVCGPLWGGVVGFVAPLLRTLLFTMPPVMVAVPMAFELAVYGAVAGVLYRIFAKLWNRMGALYTAIAVAMLGGRVLNALVKAAMLGFGGTEEISLMLIFLELFTGTWAGILVQFLLIPPLTIVLEKFVKSGK